VRRLQTKRCGWSLFPKHSRRPLSDKRQPLVTWASQSVASPIPKVMPNVSKGFSKQIPIDSNAFQSIPTHSNPFFKKIMKRLRFMFPHSFWPSPVSVDFGPFRSFSVVFVFFLKKIMKLDTRCSRMDSGAKRKGPAVGQKAENHRGWAGRLPIGDTAGCQLLCRKLLPKEGGIEIITRSPSPWPSPAGRGNAYGHRNRLESVRFLQSSCQPALQVLADGTREMTKP